MDEGTYRDLFESIRQARGETTVTLAACQRIPNISVQDAADAIAFEQHLSPLGERWREIEEATARKIVTKLLHQDLAYGAAMMTADDATHLAAEWLSLTSPPRHFLTNGNWEDANAVSWQPLTASTLDAGVVAVDKHAVVLFCVEDED